MSEPPAFREAQVDKIDCAYLALQDAHAAGDAEAVRKADADVMEALRESTFEERCAWAARVNVREGIYRQ